MVELDFFLRAFGFKILERKSSDEPIWTGLDGKRYSERRALATAKELLESAIQQKYDKGLGP